MEYKRLEQSLIDIVKEEQAKLGYRRRCKIILSTQHAESFL